MTRRVAAWQEKIGFGMAQTRQSVQIMAR